MIFRHCLLVLLLCSGSYARAQVDTSNWVPIAPDLYSFIHLSADTLSDVQQLDPVFRKLQQIKNTRSGKISVVHIGDSHIQADGMTGVVREGMQAFFGDAGRGLVFPYQLAGSNAPPDIRSSSNTSWKSNRLTFPDKPIPTGISGYGIHSGSAAATVSIGLKDMEGRQERFNRMVFFLCSEDICYHLSDTDIKTPVTFYTSSAADGTAVTVNTDEMITGFQLARVNAPEKADYGFYGVSLEKRDTPGVLYHSIGVNGARYDQYLQNGSFWHQLNDLHGDLFIVSMGTNEAQNPTINQQAIAAMCDSFVRIINGIAPGAAIIITTPAGSYYKRKKPNRSVESVSNALAEYCKSSGIACWDLFGVSGGMAGTPEWKKTGLLGNDLVHYTNAGYKLQGMLLLGALARGYAQYNKIHPFRPAKAAMPVKPEVKSMLVRDEVQQPAYVPAPKTGPAPKNYTKPTIVIPPPDEPARPGSHIKVEYSDK